MKYLPSPLPLLVLWLGLFGVLSVTNSTALAETCLRFAPSRVVELSGNLSNSATVVATDAIPRADAPGSADTSVTFNDLSAAAAFSTTINILDSIGEIHSVKIFFFHTSSQDRTYDARAYVDSGEVESAGIETGFPREVGQLTMSFNDEGLRVDSPGANSSDFTAAIAWNNRSDSDATDIRFVPFTYTAASANIAAVSIDSSSISDCSLSLANVKPTTPRVENTGASVVLRLQKFSGKVHYTVYLRRNHLTRVKRNSSYIATIRNLPAGRWKVSYVAQLTSGETETRTQRSGLREFTQQ